MTQSALPYPESPAGTDVPLGDNGQTAPVTQVIGERWKTIPEFPKYEASNRSLWHLDNGKPVQVSGGIRRVRDGHLLKATVQNRGYLRIKVYNQAGKQIDKLAHALILAAFAGECPAGMETRHLDDNPLNNTWAPGTDEEARAAGGNIVYGTKKQNNWDKVLNGNRSGPPPVPLKHCILCHDVFETPGRRCHDCLARIGVAAAALLSSGATIEQAVQATSYPSAEGLLKLAVKHGGYTERQPERWLQRVTARLRFALRGGHRA